MGNAKTPLKSTSAREHFFELQRRDLGIDQNGSRIDLNRSFGTIIAKVNRFNPSMDRMKGATLISKGEQDWLFEVEGDPSLIDRRLGGKAKRPREKGAEEEDCHIEEHQHAAVAKQVTGLLGPPQEADTNEDAEAEPPKQPNAINHRTVIRATRTPKRNRVSDPLGLGPALSHAIPGDFNCGPSRNTRSKAGSSNGGKGVHRVTSLNNPRKASGKNPEKTVVTAGGRKWKGKDKAIGESGDIAEITAGIDGFSVFSNNQVDGDIMGGKTLVAGGSIQDPTPGMVDAGDWAHSVTHSTKVGVWLEKTAEAGSQAPVDAPKSCAPSTIIDLV